MNHDISQSPGVQPLGWPQAVWEAPSLHWVAFSFQQSNKSRATFLLFRLSSTVTIL